VDEQRRAAQPRRDVADAAGEQQPVRHSELLGERLEPRPLRAFAEHGEADVCREL